MQRFSRSLAHRTPKVHLIAKRVRPRLLSPHRGLYAPRQRLDTIGRHEQCMLKLRGSLPIPRRRRPFILPLDVLLRPLTDHRLNREHVAYLHLTGLVVLIVEDVGRGVEDLALLFARKKEKRERRSKRVSEWAWREAAVCRCRCR